MATALILALSRQESAEYAREHKLYGRHATKEAARAGGYQTIIELPSFMDRPDRHAIRSAINHAQRGKARPVEYQKDEEWIRPKYRPAEPEPPYEPVPTDYYVMHPATLPTVVQELVTGADGVPDGLELAELPDVPADELPKNSAELSAASVRAHQEKLSPAPKKRGRPKGSKNKATLEREALEAAQKAADAKLEEQNRG